MTVTRPQIRETVVNEAIERAKRDCVFLFVYEYKGLFEEMIWATLTEGEPAPDGASLLCRVNHDGYVVWQTDVHTPIARTPLPPLSEIQLPIEEVQFNNVTITIPSTDPAAAYAALCQTLVQFEYTTDTFQTHGAAGESEAESTAILFPRDSAPSLTESETPITD